MDDSFSYPTIFIILQVKCIEEARSDRQTVIVRSKLLERVYSDKARPGDVDDMFPWSTTR